MKAFYGMEGLSISGGIAVLLLLILSNRCLSTRTRFLSRTVPATWTGMYIIEQIVKLDET